MRFKDAPQSEDAATAENGTLAASIVDYKFIH
jgi:hypothetical protein